jgi:outer membrane receptor protein involved in Fe transport
MITNNIYKIRERDAAGNLQAAEPTRVNPLSVIEDFDITQETNRTIGDLQLIATPFAGFKINYVLGIDHISQFGKIFIPRYPYAGVNTAFFNDGYASSASSPVMLINNDINLSYTKEAGQFSFTTYGGYNHQFNKDRYVVVQGRNMAPFVENVNGAATPLLTTDARGIFQIYGFYLQEVVGFKNQLFLTLAGRIDGSTTFSPDNRSLFYPKASISYVLSDTDWWADWGLKNAVSQFKLRASYGQAGNLTGISAYDRFYRYNTTSFGGVSAINAGATLANPDVKPERQTEIEFGTDLSFLQNRLGLSFTYYKQDISDLLIDRTVAPSQGGTGIRTNIGKLENKGFELSLNATVIQTDNMKWNLFGTFSRNRNRVTDLPQALIPIASATGAPVFILPGESVGVFYGFYYAKDENGNLLLNADGLPQRATDANGTFLRKVIGNPNPDYVWSLGSNVDFFKNFSFGFLLDAVQGNEVFNADKRTRQGVGIGDLAEKEYKGEVPRGYINSIYQIEEFRIDDGSFVKIRELSLTYRLPKVIPKVNNLSISLLGRNLYSFDNYNGYDPETNAGGQSSVLRGIDFGNVPIPRTYQVALRASF